jgi:Glyoxalase-like domain
MNHAARRGTKLSAIRGSVRGMYTKMQVVFDAADPGKLASFWALVLGYVEEPPPPGFGSWEEFGRSIGMPEENFGDQAALIDPAGEGPRLYFQRVPEGKTAKNRLHLDVRVAPREVSGAERERLVEERVAELVGAGATLAWRVDEARGKAAVLRDPEGNEFCVA